jgi:hypothetical protein
MAQPLGDKIDHHDSRDDEQENGRHVGVIELADRDHELLSDPARALAAPPVKPRPIPAFAQAASV